MEAQMKLGKEATLVAVRMPAASAPADGTGTAATRLYRDVLQHILTFLDLNEFVHACMVHRLWYATGCTMKSRQELLNYHHPVHLLTASPLRHHITQLKTNLRSSSENDFLLLRDRLAHLETLELIIYVTKPAAAAPENVIHSHEAPPPPPSIIFHLPTGLSELSLHFACWDADENMTLSVDDFRIYLSTCIKDIVTHSTRLVKLNLHISDLSDAELECPLELRNISSLTDLTLSHHFPLNQTIDLIKSMPSIRYWKPSHNFTPKSLQRLVDGSCAAQLENIGMLGKVDEALANELKHLTTLTTLCTWPLTLVDPRQLLPFLTRLTCAKLNCEDTVDVDRLSQGLSSCVTLTDLGLTHIALTSGHLKHLFPHLTHLVVLRLLRCTSVVSLDFLVHHDATDVTDTDVTTCKLHTFIISGSPLIPVKEYEHVPAALSPTLKVFKIHKSSSEPLDRATIARWTPGSPEFSREEWPKLKEFTYD